MFHTKSMTVISTIYRFNILCLLTTITIITLLIPMTAKGASPMLGWDENPAASYYVVYWRAESETSFSHSSTNMPAGTTSFQLMPSPDGTVYVYSIKAFNKCGEASDFSDEIKTPNIPYDSTLVSSINPSTAKISLAIILPVDGTTGIEGNLNEFSANVYKNDQLTTVCDVTWTSSIDGIIGKGIDIKTVLSPGIHVIIATTQDEFGNTGSDTLVFMVEAKNTPPQISNLTATAGVTAMQGQTYQFSGKAGDTEDGDISNNIEWTSNISGNLGKGAMIQATLSPGTHMITASISDSKGASVSSTIKVTAETYNTPPVVTIQKIGPGASTPDGQTYDLYGNATDLEDGDITSKIFWISSINGSLGTGAHITPILSAGTHIITAKVTDSKGKISEITQTVTVLPYNYPPVVTITSSVKGNTVSGVQAYEFNATAIDKEDGDIGSSIKWISSKDGNLGTGPKITVNLTAGLHIVTATASDSKGKTGSATLQISVEAVNTAPTVSITSSTPGTLGPNGQVYGFSGTASDAEDGNLSAAISWSSSKDGNLGTGPSINPTLTSGTHTITAAVTDRFGKSSTATLQVTVAVYDTPPVVAITSASPGVLSAAGQSYSFTGTATDKEDGSLGSSITWTSSKDGNLGTGSSIKTTLTPGSHTITAQVSDSLGKKASASISTNVDTYNTPPVTTITSAIPRSQDEKGQTYSLTGKVIDKEDGDLSWSIAWISSKDGNIGTGASIQPVLTVGSHTITASAFDSKGKSSTYSIQITVSPYNYPPSTAITSITAGEISPSGQLYAFTGRVIDPEDGDISSNIIWSSNKSGVLGKGSSIMVTLSSGQQTITATGTDSKGKSTGDSRVIVVEGYNNPPVVKISSASAGSQTSSGQTYILTGTATDMEDGDLSTSISWSSSISGSLGTGSMITRALSTGTHAITATVSDKKGKSSQTAISITVPPYNNPPAMTSITSSKGSSTLSGQIYTFSANASDAEDGDLSSAISWSINTKGLIGKGASAHTVLPSGNFVVTASVTDSKGKTTITTKSLSVSWSNAAPVVDGLEAAPGTSGSTGQMFTLSGRAIDEEEGNLSNSLVWSSSIDGVIGTGAKITAILSAGSHTIQAKATDSLGKSTTASMALSVASFNTPPHVDILNAIEGTQTSNGQVYEFDAKATDREDGNLSTSIVWSSSRDGNLGKGARIKPTLSDGTHTITAKVTDSKGKEDIRTMNITAKKQSSFRVQVTLTSFFSLKVVSVSWSGATSVVNIYKNNKVVGSGDSQGSRYYWYTGPAQYKIVDVLTGKSSRAKSVR